MEAARACPGMVAATSVATVSTTASTGKPIYWTGSGGGSSHGGSVSGGSSRSSSCLAAVIAVVAAAAAAAAAIVLVAAVVGPVAVTESMPLKRNKTNFIE